MDSFESMIKDLVGATDASITPSTKNILGSTVGDEREVVVRYRVGDEEHV